MAPDQDLASSVRTALAGTALIREVEMFGGTAFMLRGNMLVAASPRGLLVRVGKDAHEDALARPGARPLQMKGRAIVGYIFVDPKTLAARELKNWLALAFRFVETLPAKRWASPVQRTSKPLKAGGQAKRK